MPYYDDEMTDRAVNAYFRYCQRKGLCPIQPNRYDTYRDGDMIVIQTGDWKLAQYRVYRGPRGDERLRNVA